MAKIEGLTRLVEQLKAKAAAATKDSNVSVSVGYTQAYALYVHENMEMVHRVGKAKFLEDPAKELSSNGTLPDIIKGALAKGRTMSQAMLLAGLRLQRESQKQVPVDTGALKNSAFTRLEVGGSVQTQSDAGASGNGGE